MARTELTRRQHARAGNRYASDLTDAEWALIAPLMPPRKATGRPRTTRLRDVFDAILCIAPTGCQWRMLPNDFPPVSTVRGDFHAWRDTGLLDEIDRKLVEAARVTGNRKSQPTAGIIDSQSVKTTESGGVSGDDAGKRIEGRKRHIVTDTTGLLVRTAVQNSATVAAGQSCCGRRKSRPPLPFLATWRAGGFSPWTCIGRFVWPVPTA